VVEAFADVADEVALVVTGIEVVEFNDIVVAFWATDVGISVVLVNSGAVVFAKGAAVPLANGAVDADPFVSGTVVEFRTCLVPSPIGES
jgi:hypothetical protein